jgi:hypothetical protein
MFFGNLKNVKRDMQIILVLSKKENQRYINNYKNASFKRWQLKKTLITTKSINSMQNLIIELKKYGLRAKIETGDGFAVGPRYQSDLLAANFWASSRTRPARPDA